MKWTLNIAGQKVTVDNPTSVKEHGKFLNFMRKNSRTFNDIFDKAGM
jgi:hypothetical protein